MVRPTFYQATARGQAATDPSWWTSRWQNTLGIQRSENTWVTPRQISTNLASGYQTCQDLFRENTKELLRQYFPKSTDLSIHSPEDLEFVAQKINQRQRKTLDCDTPAERSRELISN